MPRWLQWRVCFSFLHISSILSGCCDRFASGTREYIFILLMRHPILSNTKTPFRCMWTMNTAPNNEVCRSMNLKAYQAAISFSLQWLQDPVNHPLIHMICPAMIKDSFCLTMWLRWHPDEAITQHAYWPPPGSISIRCLARQQKGEIHPNLNDYHSDRMEISSTFCMLDISTWWRQHEEMHS